MEEIELSVKLLNQIDKKSLKQIAACARKLNFTTYKVIQIMVEQEIKRRDN